MTVSPQFRSRLTYPNPFRPSGVEFDLPEGARVTLKILDAAGREVASLIEGTLFGAGTHHVEFEPAFWRQTRGEAQRVFYYRLSIEIDGKNYTDTKQIPFSKH